MFNSWLYESEEQRRQREPNIFEVLAKRIIERHKQALVAADITVAPRDIAWRKRQEEQRAQAAKWQEEGLPELAQRPGYTNEGKPLLVREAVGGLQRAAAQGVIPTTAAMPEVAKGVGEWAITPRMTEQQYEQIHGIPVVGPIAAPHLAGLTSPLGSYTTALLPELTAGMIAGGVAGGVAGKGLEEAGVPVADVGPIRVGPSGVLETAGMLAGPLAIPALERAAMRGAAQVPTAARAGTAQAQRLAPGVRRLIAEEAGGPTPRPPAPKPPPEPVAPKPEVPPVVVPEEGRLMPRMVKIEEAVAEGFEPNVLRRMAEKVEGVPGVSHGIRLVNPSAIPDHELGRATIGYMRSLESGTAANRMGIAHLRSRSFPFEINAQGIEAKSGQHINDLAERWPRYKHLFGAEENKFVQDTHRLLDEAIAEFKAAGGDLHELGFAKGEHWIPRQVLGKEGIQKMQAYTKGRLRAKQPFERTRFHEYVSDGMAAGVDYNRDFLGTIETALNAIRRATADQMLVNIVKGRGIKGVKGAPFALPGRMFGRGEGYVSVAQPAPGEFPGLQGRVFLAEDLDVLRRTLGDRAPAWLQGAEQLSAAMRVPMTAFDPGFMFIQGLGVLGKDISNLATGRPTAVWARASTNSFKTFLDPKNHARYLAQFAKQNPKMAEQYARYVRGISFSEFMESARPGGLIYKARKVPLVGSLVRRAQGAFDGFMDVGGVETWKATSRYAKSPEQLEQLGAHVRNMMGMTSTRGLGVSPTQRAFEAAIVRFAPRYTRSVFALMADAAQGGLRGSEALRALGGMAFGATATYLAVCWALGQEPELRPWKGGRFMAVKLGNNYLGIGGAYRATLAAISRIIAAGVDDPESLSQWWGTDAARNPILRYLRGGSAPLTSTSWDLISGETFIYQQLDDPIDYLRMPARVLPFGVQALIDAEGGWKAKGTAGGAEWFGFRSFPVGPWEKLDDLTRKHDPQGRSWDELSVVEKREMAAAHPDVQEQRDIQLRRGLERESPYAERTAYMNELKERQKTAIQESLRVDPSGAAAAQLIKDTKVERVKAYEEATTLLGITDKPKESELLPDFYADQYLAVEADADESGYITPEEWERYDAERQAVIQEAVAAGVPDAEAYIKKRATTFWGEDAPQLNILETYYQQAKESMREYQAIPRFIGVPDDLAKRAEAILQAAQAMVATQGVPLNYAIAVVGKDDPQAAMIAAMESRLRNPMRSLFWKQHPELSVFWGRGAPAYLDMETVGV